MVVNGEQIIWIVKNKYNVYNNMDIQIKPVIKRLRPLHPRISNQDMNKAFYCYLFLDE